VVINGDTLTIHVENLALQDEFAFPGTVRVPSSLSFDITYTKSGSPRKIKANHDPISAFDWSGRMWMATNSGTFSVSHSDGSFSAQGSFSSSGLFGEMGTERNGAFANHDDGNTDAAQAPQSAVESPQAAESLQSPEAAPLVLRSRTRRMPK
jgi:hypothetical protein